MALPPKLVLGRPMSETTLIRDHNALVNDTRLLIATTGNAGGNRAWVHLPVHSHYAKLEEVGPAGMVIAPDANCPIHGSAAQLEEHD